MGKNKKVDMSGYLKALSEGDGNINTLDFLKGGPFKTNTKTDSPIPGTHWVNGRGWVKGKSKEEMYMPPKEMYMPPKEMYMPPKKEVVPSPASDASYEKTRKKGVPINYPSTLKDKTPDFQSPNSPIIDPATKKPLPDIKTEPIAKGTNESIFNTGLTAEGNNIYKTLGSIGNTAFDKTKLGLEGLTAGGINTTGHSKKKKRTKLDAESLLGVSLPTSVGVSV